MIAVITHPRPGGVSYLAQTLASIDESAKGLRALVCDDLAHELVAPPPWQTFSFQAPMAGDNRWALWRCFRLAVERCSDLVVFEDDVRLCRGGALYAETLQVPDGVAWVSLYDPWFRPQTPRGLWRSKAGGSAWAQALKFPLRTCQLLDSVGCVDVDQAGSDKQLAIVGRLFDLDYAVHVPSLVQHIGVVSSVGTGGVNVSESFDAGIQ
jgi:hypothetical protein